MRGEHLELLRKVVASQKWSGEDSAWTGPTAPEWSLLADGLAFSQPTSYMCWGISSQKLAPLPTLPDTHRGNAWSPHGRLGDGKAHPLFGLQFVHPENRRNRNVCYVCLVGPGKRGMSE